MLTKHNIEIVDAIFQAKRDIIEAMFQVLEQEKTEHTPEERNEYDEARIAAMTDMIDAIVNWQGVAK